MYIPGGYQYCGPGTKFKKRLARDDPGINRLDKVCKQHDIDYSNSSNVSDRNIADRKMVDAINSFDNKNMTEKMVKNILNTK